MRRGLPCLRTRAGGLPAVVLAGSNGFVVDTLTNDAAVARLSRLESAAPDVWGVEARYGQLKAKRLADLLNQYGVRPERDASRTIRGYLWQDFAGPFSRYLSGDVSDVSRSTHGADASDRLDGFPDTLPGVAL